MGSENVQTSSSKPSPEEIAILELLAEGLKDDVIARRLGLAIRTYRRRLDSVWAKLGARSRFQAGALAAQLGWVRVSVAERSGDDLFWPTRPEGTTPLVGEQERSRTNNNTEG